MPVVIKRGLLLACLAVASLLVILLVRTAPFLGTPPTYEPARPLPLDAAAAARRLAGALRIRTISYEDRARIEGRSFSVLHDYMTEAFPAVHRRLRREVVNGSSLLYTWPGSDSALAPLLLLAHMDVVPVEPGTESRWTQTPFGGRIAGGFVWGRGSMDMKGTVMGTLEALEHLLHEGYEPRRTILLAFGHDEEIGGEQGARVLADLLQKKGVQPFLILDEGMAVVEGAVPGIEAPVAFVGIAEKGYVSVELSAEAEGGHSSMPPRQTAVGIIASAIHSLQQEPMPAHLEGPATRMLESLAPAMAFPRQVVLANLWLFGGLLTQELDNESATRALIRTTFAPTMLKGGVKDNILPARASAVVNIRIHPSDRIDDALAHLEGVVADPRVRVRPVDGLAVEPSRESSVNGRGFKLLTRTIQEIFPDVLVAPTLVLGATDSRHYAGLGSEIFRFVPLRLAMADTVRIHGTDERVAVDNYGEVVAFYTRLIQNADGIGSEIAEVN